MMPANIVYKVKVIKEERKDGGIHRLIQADHCTHYTVREVPEGSIAAKQGLCESGITIELGPPAKKSFNVPKDGDVIYIENGDGRTMSKYPSDYVPLHMRADIRDKVNNGNEAEFRVTETSVEQS